MGGAGGKSLISPDGVAPIRMVGVSASVIFPCTIKVQKKIRLAPAHPGSPGKRAVKRLCACVFPTCRHSLHVNVIDASLSADVGSRLGDGTEKFGDALVMVENRRLDGSDLTELVGNGRVQFQQLRLHRFYPRLRHTAHKQHIAVVQC